MNPKSKKGKNIPMFAKEDEDGGIIENEFDLPLYVTDHQLEKKDPQYDDWWKEILANIEKGKRENAHLEKNTN